MEHLEIPPTVDIKHERFDIIKSKRLLPGMVLKSREREAYARLGPKVSTLEEQIHTVSLYERGFPVARVLESGKFGEDEWYFIEESLGDTSFHEQFTIEYQKYGYVSDETFARYFDVISQYIDAQSADNNRASISPSAFIESVIADEYIIANYAICSKDVEKYKQAVAKATRRLAEAPMGVLQFDLNPYNILARGVIDFELVGYGPIGYDTLLVSLWHRWFTDDETSRFHVAYYLSEAQATLISEKVSEIALANNVADPTQYLQEFLLIKSAWGFTSLKAIDEEEPSKRAFYEYRAGLLEHCVDCYLSGQQIDPMVFPQMHT